MSPRLRPHAIGLTLTLTFAIGPPPCPAQVPPAMPPGIGANPAGPGQPAAPGADTPDAETQANSFPPMYRGQVRAVLEFIDAVKERDADALAEATALRAAKDPDVPTDHQKIFQAILDKELADEKMEHLADQFEGYRVTNVIVGKSTGRANVIIGKMTSNDRIEKTVVVRKEKAGWKVMDFTSDRSYVGRKSRKSKR